MLMPETTSSLCSVYHNGIPSLTQPTTNICEYKHGVRQRTIIYQTRADDDDCVQIWGRSDTDGTHIRVFDFEETDEGDEYEVENLVLKNKTESQWILCCQFQGTSEDKVYMFILKSETPRVITKVHIHENLFSVIFILN